MDDNIKSEIRKLCENSTICYLASVNENGFPQIKAMLTVEHGNMKEHCFSTNASSKRVAQFLRNPKASVYYCEPDGFKGALFTGKIEVLTDHATKALLWREGDEIYYSQGVDDEDYCVLRFTAETVNYYHGLGNVTLSIDDF